MNISRRTFLQRAAAVPLVTIPGLAHSASSEWPTANEVFAKGANCPLVAVFPRDDLKMKTLLVECASQLHVVFEESTGEGIAHKLTDNVTWFMLKYAEVPMQVWGMKVMLTDYNLPLVPGHMESFKTYHKSAGDFIMDAVRGNNPESDFLRSGVDAEIKAIVANNPRFALGPKHFCQTKWSYRQS